MTTGIVTTSEVLAKHLGWMRSGTRRFLELADTLTGTDPHLPSGLPGWTRAHVLAHTAQNADALINLLTWARTGVPTPMYASPEVRGTAIEAAVDHPMPKLLAELRASAERLDTAVGSMPEASWAARVLTAQGRSVPAADVPWMRVREVWLHAIDLLAGSGFEAVPAELAVALVRDIARTIGAKNRGAGFVVAVEAEGTRIDIPVDQEPAEQTVRGTAIDLLAWLSGRDTSVPLFTNGDLPTLPKWL